MFSRIIDTFAAAPARANLPAREAGRRRKLVAFLFVLLIVSALSAGLWFAMDVYLGVAGTMFTIMVLVAALFALRRGAPAWLVTCVVLFCGVCVSGLLALSTRKYGLSSLTWIVLAPLVAIPVGGRRAGWITLALSTMVIVVCDVGIHQRWLKDLVTLEHPIEAQLASLLGVLASGFLLTRAYEVETQAEQVALESQNHALLEAQAAAVCASRAKSEFIATVSHEIRTPLNGVTGLVTLLREETDPTRLREGLRIIQQSSDTLLAVINDVLDFSKIESNHLHLEQVPVSIEHELRLVIELLQSGAAEKGTELELSLHGVPAWILGDPTRLRQVALNLVANAVKFTSEGRVSVSGRMVGDQLTLEITDTGIGMPQEVQDRLFEPFVQADTSTTRRFGGTGLGLVISRRLVRSMGGDITVVSQTGLGSRFTVSMPVLVTAAPPAAERVIPVISAPRQVLVAEDNRVNQVVVVRLLQKLGHQVTVACDGEEALCVSGRRRFDLILMDCHMPVLDGYEATRRLRARGDATPVFALTAAVTNEDHARCLSAGMTGVLSKPLRADRLNEVVNSVPPMVRLLPSTGT